jgi:hypothetical protein
MTNPLAFYCSLPVITQPMIDYILHRSVDPIALG